MFLRIQNDGICEVEAFTMFGVSSARGADDKIGQFGSGAKHAVMLCLRNSITPRIFLGKSELIFGTEQFSVREKTYSKIWYSYEGTRENLSYVLEFGALDWNDVTMALREFISNAMDAGGHKVDIVSEVAASEGKTTIFVPLNDAIREYYTNIKRYFLHFVGLEKLTLIPNPRKERCRIYRKGVFVRESESPIPSLFHYNFDASLRIDECRNLSEYALIGKVCEAVTKNEQLTRAMFRVFRDKTTCFEANLPYSHLNGNHHWKQWWEEETNGAYMLPMNSKNLKCVQQIVERGHTLIEVPTGWYDELKRRGVETYTSVLLDNEHNNTTPVKTNPETERIVKQLHNILSDMGLTKGKACPITRNFATYMGENGEFLKGYYIPGSKEVWISDDCPEDFTTILEEMSHYYTGFSDMTRGFQDYAFNIAGRLLRSRCNGAS